MFGLVDAQIQHPQQKNLLFIKRGHNIRRRTMYRSLNRGIHESLLWYFFNADLALLFSLACNFSDVLQFYCK